jgi:hypothetical protein
MLNLSYLEWSGAAVARNLNNGPRECVETYIIEVDLPSSIVRRRNPHGPCTEERERSAIPPVQVALSKWDEG